MMAIKPVGSDAESHCCLPNVEKPISGSGKIRGPTVALEFVIEKHVEGQNRLFS
jgi:hypothetical protein